MKLKLINKREIGGIVWLTVERDYRLFKTTTVYEGRKHMIGDTWVMRYRDWRELPGNSVKLWSKLDVQLNKWAEAGECENKTKAQETIDAIYFGWSAEYTIIAGVLLAVTIIILLKLL